MKKKLFLHVGPPKTGTTTIQHFLAENRDNLALAGILYPLHEPSHWKLALRVGLTMWPWTVDEHTTPSWDEIARISAENPDKHLLLSSESFSYAVLSAKKEGSKKLVENLNSLGRELHIIIYLRRQDLWVESYFIEYLKHFGKGGLDTFLEERKDSLDYYKVLSFWSNLSGKDHLSVRVYEPQQLPDIRGDFMRFLGIEDLSGFRLSSDKNHRPSLLQMQVLNGYVETFHQKFPAPYNDFNKAYGPMDAMLGQFLHKASQWPSTHKFRILPYDKAGQIMAACETSNARAAAEFLDRADGQLFYEKLSPYEHDELIWPSPLDTKQKATIAALWKETCDLMGELLKVTEEDGYSEFEKLLQDNKEMDIDSEDKADYSVERYAPEVTDFEISYEHWHRYLYATNFSKGKNVLDIASGEGYGAFLLAENAAKVVGVDIDRDAIKHATQKYQKENLSFLEGSVSQIPIEGKAKFDLIVSFETIEHVDAVQQAAFLSEVKRLLRPGGVFIVSTPDKLVYSDLPNYQNEFHVKEFYADEFTDFLQGNFEYVEVLGQDIYTSSFIHPAAGTGGFQEYNLALDGFFKPQKDAAGHDAYMVALCSDKSLSPLPSSLLFNSKNKRADYDLSYQVLYVDTGKGFNESESLLMNLVEKNKAVVFDLSGFHNIKNLRFDPSACPVYLKINSVSLKTAEGQQMTVVFSTNALQEEPPFFLFDTDDPQVFLDLLPGLSKFNAIVFDLEYVAIGAAVYPYLKKFSVEKTTLLESTLGSKESEISRIYKELQMSSLLLDKTESQLALQKRLADLAESQSADRKATIDSLTLRLSVSEELITSKETQLQQLVDSLQMTKATMDGLAQHLSVSGELIISKEAQLQQLLDSLQKALESVSALEIASAGKDADLQAKEKSIGSLQKQVERLIDDIGMLRSDIAQKEERLGDLNTLLVQYQKEKSVLSKQYEAVAAKFGEVDAENNERGKYIGHLNRFVGRLENTIHERDGDLARLKQDALQKAQYISELKNSFSFRLGWAITAPFRWTYEGLKMAFWAKFLGIAWKHSDGFFKNLTSEKITILRRALKNEPPSLILRNFAKLLSGQGHQMVVVRQKEEEPPILPAKKEEPKPTFSEVAFSPGPPLEKQEAPNPLLPKPPAESLEIRKIHYFIDQMEEMDFHFSVRGWLFVESHEIETLSIVMSQGSQEVRANVFYHIERPDVFNHFGNKNGLRSGFSDAVEKPFAGKVKLSLIATFPNGGQSVTHIGETEFNEPYLHSFSRDILANRSEFGALGSQRNGRRQSVALYTNSGGNYFFNEIKALVAKGFESLGYIVHDMNETHGFDNDALLHIIIAPHEFFEIGDGKKYVEKPSDRLVLLNTEQPSSAWFRKGTAYFPHAIEVWDMNYYSWQRLHETITHARFLPLGFAKDFGLLDEVRQLPENYCTCFLDEKIKKGSFLQYKFEDRPIDILFIGHASPHRQHFFAKHAAFFAKYNCYFHLTDIALGPILDTKTNMNTRTAIGLAQRSKIILNIHHGTHPYFEWHRMVMHGIWQRGLVVSDICGEGPPFVAGRDFYQATLDELPAKIAYFLETDAGKAEANEMIRSAYNVLASQCDLARSLQLLMAPLLAPKDAPTKTSQPSSKKSKRHGRKR